MTEVSYQTLYRKYRPQKFSEIIGQKHVTQTLQNAVRSDRISHAYLFCGPRGTGKTTTARVVAMAMNCEQGPTPEPCGKCSSCQSIAIGSSLDVIEIDAASNRGIDDIRELRERVKYAPASSRYKVYVVDEVHMLTPEAFNALLKTLEEPPQRVIFVLATTEPHRLPPTILSRCQRFDFHRVALPEIIERLKLVIKEEGWKVEEPAIQLLGRAADGSVRDALSLLDQAVAYAGDKISLGDVQTILGGIDSELLFKFTDIILNRDLDAAFRIVDQVVSEGKDIRQLVGQLIGHWRDLLMITVCREGDREVVVSPEHIKRLVSQAKQITPQEILSAIEVMSAAEQQLRWHSQQRLIWELCMVRLCAEPAVEAAPIAAQQPAAQQPAARRPAPKKAQEKKPAPAKKKSKPAEGATLQAIEETWEAVISRLKEGRQTAVVAFLKEARPLRVEENRLTLGFSHEFHRDQMANEERQQMVADAIREELGAELIIRCELLSPSSQESKDQAGSDAVDKIRSTFPGSEVV